MNSSPVLRVGFSCPTQDFQREPDGIPFFREQDSDRHLMGSKREGFQNPFRLYFGLKTVVLAVAEVRFLVTRHLLIRNKKLFKNNFQFRFKIYKRIRILSFLILYFFFLHKNESRYPKIIKRF